MLENVVSFIDGYILSSGETSGLNQCWTSTGFKQLEMITMKFRMELIYFRNNGRQLRRKQNKTDKERAKRQKQLHN